MVAVVSERGRITSGALASLLQRSIVQDRAEERCRVKGVTGQAASRGSCSVQGSCTCSFLVREVSANHSSVGIPLLRTDAQELAWVGVKQKK